MKQPLSDNRGLTLIELVVGVVIMAVIAVPLLHSFVASASTARKSEVYRNATDAAQNIIEEIESSEVSAYIVENGAAYDNTLLAYTIRKENIISGNCRFDALITLSAAKDPSGNPLSVNSSPVAVGNPMDAVIDMNTADDIALNELNAKLSGLSNISPQPSLENLTRKITVTADKSGSGVFRIETVFSYSGSFTGKNDKKEPKTIDFSESNSIIVKDSASVNAKNSFSLYLFFKAYYAGRDVISIKNSDWKNSDFKVFLVSSNDGAPPASYKADIRYRCQTDRNKVLVFTNLNSGGYKSFISENWVQMPLIPLSGSLVEQKSVDRLYSVSVKIFEHGKGFEGGPLAELSSQKLS